MLLISRVMKTWRGVRGLNEVSTVQNRHDHVFTKRSSEFYITWRCGDEGVPDSSQLLRFIRKPLGSSSQIPKFSN